MNKTPQISIIMPVYNAKKNLSIAIKSMLAQTFTDFEFIIIDDGSTDNSLQIIQSFTDPRILVISFPKNKKIVAALNAGIESARGKYIARMDADDISHPDRLAIQLNYLEKNPNIDLVGTGMFKFQYSKKGFNCHLSLVKKGAGINVKLLFTTPFAHPSILLKKEIFKNILYSSNYPLAEDYKLFHDILKVYNGHNLEQPLYYYRLHEGNSTIHQTKQKEGIKNVQKDIFAHLRMSLDDLDLELHYAISTGRNSGYPAHFLVRWANKLFNFNKKSRSYDQLFLKRYLFASLIRYGMNNRIFSIFFWFKTLSFFSIKETFSQLNLIIKSKRQKKACLQFIEKQHEFSDI